MILGTIVKSNSHISYLCHVLGRLETDAVPPGDAYAFGTFVALAPAANSSVRLIGVVRDTLLLNPEFGNLGPRLSSDRELAVLSPDYLNEKGVLVEILVLGWESGGLYRHGIPALAAHVGTVVEGTSEEEFVAFHRDDAGRLLVGYLPALVTPNDPVLTELLLTVLARLKPRFPLQNRLIAVLENNLAWKARVVPAG